MYFEDEICFFVDGQGLFWFYLENGEIFNVFCQKGDLIFVLVGMKYWFDVGEKDFFVKVICIFIDMSGWVLLYMELKVEQKFNDFIVLN